MTTTIIVRPRPSDESIDICARQLLAGALDTGSAYVLDRAIWIAKHENLDVCFVINGKVLTPDLAYRLRDRGIDLRRIAPTNPNQEGS